MPAPGAPGLLSRRSTLAGSVSLVLHGGLILVALVLVGARVADAPRRIALTTIEVVSPQPPTPAPAPVAATAAAPRATVPAATRPSRATPAPRRAATATEALDLRVSYDDPSNFASRPTRAPDEDGTAGGIAGAIAADGRRQLQDSLANLQIPVPPPVSHARAARPRHNYHQLRLHSVRRFAGLTIKLLLTIDARGRVSDVGLVEGVDGQLDRRVVELARRFEFEPALDADGAPVAGTSKWDIQIVDDDNGQLRNSMERGYY